jgi:DsbC/DsbD-like thiol-disulfide interchange protein
MTTTGRVLGLALAACLAWVSAGSEAQAQGKKSDSVVKVQAEAGTANADGTVPVRLTLTVEPGWHVYANPVGQEDLAEQATTVTAGGKAKVEGVEYPPGKLVRDKTLGDYKVYENQVTITAKVRRPNGGGPIELAVKLQACNESKCLLPATVKVPVR